MDGLVISDAVKDLIINIINIIVLFVIVRTLAYKPVKKFLDSRKERIADQLEEANKKMSAAEDAEKRYNELIGQSKAEGEELIRNAELTARENADRIIANAEKQADEIRRKARENAESERKAQLAAAKDGITDLAFDISRQILAREVSEEDNRQLVEAFFNSADGTELK